MRLWNLALAHYRRQDAKQALTSLAALRDGFGTSALGGLYGQLGERIQRWSFQPEPPDWDSGWRLIAPGETITLPHGLGTNVNRYIVRMEFKAVPEKGSPEAPMAIHHHAYGGTPSNILAEDAAYMGANWQNLTNQSITVYRWADDPLADEIRVRIWLRRMSVYLPVVVK